MATTFTLKSQSYQGRYLQLSCTQTKNITANTSKISWTLTSTGGTSTYYTTGPTTVKINGETVYYKDQVSWSKYVFPAAPGSTSGTITVNHDNEGKAEIPVSITTSIYTGVIETRSGTWILDNIERYAVLKSAPNFNDEENPTITYSNPAGNSVTTLQACISLTGSKADIAYRDISKTGTSYTFNLTDAERKVLRSATTTSNSRTVIFYVRTYFGETSIASTLTRTLTIKNPNPTINPTIVDTNATTSALTGDSERLIRYYSNAAITIGASAVKEATLTSKQVTCGTKCLTEDGTINSVTSGSFLFTATDSRGNTTKKTVTPNFINYVKLTCSIGNNMPDASGHMTVKATGNYFNGSFGATSNSLNVYYRYKTVGGSYGSWTEMTVTKSSSTYSATASLTGLDYQTTYVVQTYAKDKLATVYSAEKNVKATPVFDWGENDFKFNVPVYDEFGALVGNGLAAYAGGGDNGIDPNTTLEGLCLTSHTNAPQGKGTFYFILTAFYNGKTTSSSRAQIAFPYNKSGQIYHRHYTSGAWSSWSCEHNHQYVTSAGSFRLAEGWMGLYDTLANAASHTTRKGWIGYNGGDIMILNDDTAGGIALKSGGALRFYGAGSTNFVATLSDRFRSSANDVHYLGDASCRWKAVYAVNGTIQTSDRNQKKNIEEVGQKYIDLFDRLLPVSFMFNDAESDRMHIGFISQDVKAAMDEVGLTDLDFAGFCCDVLTEWDEETQTEKEVLDDSGNPVYVYSLRYTEFIALNTRMIQLNRQKLADQEREIKSLRDDIESLKEAINKLTKELG